MGKTKKMADLLLVLFMLVSFTGCRNAAVETAANTADTVLADEAETEKTTETEEEANIPYLEEQGLEFCMDASVQTTGALCLANNTDDADVIDVTWYLDDIYAVEANDKQTITIKQHTDGYFWGNGSDVFKTNLMLPSGKIYDRYTGSMIPVSTKETAETSTVEWGGKKYAITNVESHEWKNDDWSNWVEDPDGGERLKSTLYVTNEIMVDSADYDGLVLLLQPITDFEGSLDGAYIADVWTNDCYLFDLAKFAESFKLAGAEAEAMATEAEESTVAESENTEKNEAETEKEPVTEKEEAAENPKEEKTAAPAHKHDYKGTVTANATCTNTGVKTFTCSCGDSYTEAIPQTAHDFSVPVTQTVWHDEVWQDVPKTVTVKYIQCHSCRGIFYTDEDFQNHFSTCDGLGSFDICTETKTVYERIKVSDGYNEDVTVGYKCSVCGTIK